MATRRDVVRGVAGLAAGAAVIGSAGAQSTESDHYAAKPDDVELVYDEDYLLKYRPTLQISHLDEQPEALHAFVARDTLDADNPHATNALVYWAEYLIQDGVSPATAGPFSDSHFGDHEPIIVFVNKADQRVERVVYSAYHWLKGSAPSPPVYDGTHPQLYVFDPHHHYRVSAQAGEFVELRDLTESYPAWLKNGLDESIEPGATTNPWSMRDRESWWRDAEAAGISWSTEELLASVWYQLGFDNAEATDL
jgi:hypothetical protein